MTIDRAELVTIDEMHTEAVEDVQAPLDLGSWYWLKVQNRDYETTGGTHEVLTCVHRVGSNFAKLKDVGGNSWRVPLSERPDPGDEYDTDGEEET